MVDVEMTSSKFSLENCKYPVVFKDAISAWKCSSWTLDCWACKAGNVKLKFRIGFRTPTERPQWESDSTYQRATIREFSQWTAHQADSQNSLKGVHCHSQFLYAGYNHMCKVFSEVPEILEVHSNVGTLYGYFICATFVAAVPELG